MRVLQICSSRSIGGGERHVIDLSNELARRGHQVFAALAPDSPVRVRLTHLPPENIVSLPLRNAIDVRSAAGIAKFAERSNVDLMNAHLARDYPLVAAASRFTGIPYVITRHVLFPMSRLQKVMLRNARFVISPSNAVAENLRHEGIFPSDKIVTIRYGLDVESYQQRTKLRSDGFTIGSIGNLDPVKGFDVLVRAAKKVVEAVPRAKLVIVGEDRSRDGRNEMLLRELIRKLDLDQAVELKGWSDNVGAQLAEFDVFVSSSRSESFGFVIAEAMLAGVPVIATATQGAMEIISDESLGLIVPIDSEVEIANAIIRLANNRPLRETLAAAGPAHIAENFSSQRMVDETELLYQKVIDSAGG